MGFRDIIKAFKVWLFVKTEVATRGHRDIKHFSVILTTCDDIPELDSAPSSLKSLCRMSFKYLFRGYGYCEVKIVFILTHFNRLCIVILLDVTVENWDDNPLRLVQSDLEEHIDCNNAKNEDGT